MALCFLLPPIFIYDDALHEHGVTRPLALLAAVVWPVFAPVVLYRIHRHEAQAIRRLEEERLDRELKRLEEE